MAPRELPMSPAEARTLAAEYRALFRDAEAFELAWNAIFELKTAATLTLSRRILGEELQKFRAHSAGLEARISTSPAPMVYIDPGHRFRCPDCGRDMAEWQRDGHAADCQHVGCYELEIRARVAIERRHAAAEHARAERLAHAAADWEEDA